jgi:hypothetical protein
MRFERWIYSHRFIIMKYLKKRLAEEAKEAKAAVDQISDIPA